MSAGLSRTCPVCNARPGWPCTAPTDTGRRVVAWMHMSREKDNHTEEVDEP